MSLDMYGSFAAVYDEFMDNVPYGPWSRKIIALLKKYGIEDGLVLDLCCGTGNMTERLAQAGYDMIGVDSSVEMRQIAEEKKLKTGHDILYLNQDMRTFELYGTVRAIVCVCDSLNYLLSENDLQKVFRLAYNYLDPDGLFIFNIPSCMYSSVLLMRYDVRPLSSRRPTVSAFQFTDQYRHDRFFRGIKVCVDRAS